MTSTAFDDVLDDLRALYHVKRADYADEDPWSNFLDAGRQIGQPAGMAVELHIATKQSRLRQLLFGRSPKNEPVEDTIRDRAVYSVIAYAMFREGHYRDGNDNGTS